MKKLFIHCYYNSTLQHTLSDNNICVKGTERVQHEPNYLYLLVSESDYEKAAEMKEKLCSQDKPIQDNSNKQYFTFITL